MTPEELEKLVAMADTAALVKAVEKLSETERRKLSKTAGRLYRDIDRVRFDFNPQTNLQKEEPLERLKNLIKGKKITIHNQYIAAKLAALACCPISTVRRVDGRGGQKATDHVLKILTDRQPDWIDEWIDEKLKGEWFSISWPTVRALVNKGMCSKPASDGYINLMVQDLPGAYYENKTNYIPTSKKLLDDPDLLEDEVWRLFEVETYAFWVDYMEDREGVPENYETWPKTLKKLSENGHLDRQRLLEASLSGLTTGFKNNALTGYIKFHTFLEPSIDEMTALQETYIDLLSNKASHVVTFALKMLKMIDKEKKLDDRAFISAASSVLNIKTKGQPKTAIMFLKRIIKRNPDLKKDILKGAVNGLIHESVDIQDQIITLIEAHADVIDEEMLSSIASKAMDISATHQSRIDGILEKTGLEKEDNLSSSLDDLEEIYRGLLEKVSKIDPVFSKYTGLNLAPDTFSSMSFLPAMTFNISEVPLLTGLQKIEPIETIDELIDAVAHAVEIVDSADEVERILDGISRLCDQKPDDFEKRTEPILKRINKDTASETSRGLVHSWGAPFAIYQLLIAWLTGKKVTGQGPNKYASDVWLPITARLNELTDRVLKKEAVVMLSSPTHEHGWIDSSVLVDRLLLLQERNIDLPKHDFLQALLRIAPDRKDKAFIACSSLKGMLRHIMTWILNGAESSPNNDKEVENKSKIKTLTKKVVALFNREHVRKKDAPFWLAAGRARFPLSDLSNLNFLKHTKWGPDGLVPAQYHWEAEIKKQYNKWSKKIYYINRLDLAIKPETMAPDKTAYYPTIALHMRKEKWSAYGVHSPWLFQWISMMWLQNTDPFFATGIHSLDLRMDDNSSTFDPNFTFLEPLLETDRPISEMGSLALWLGLAGRDADARGYALDVLAEAIEDGRAHPDILGPTLVKLGKNGWLKLNRLKATLGDTARLSSLHAYVIALILDQWLAAQDELPRDAHYLLTLILELNIKLGISLSENACLPLDKVKGSSKTAKLSKKLLQHHPEKPGHAVNEALLQQLEQRVARAERWQEVEN